MTAHTYNGSGTWIRLDGDAGSVDLTGRLIGGCVETLCNLAGTPFADVARFAADHAPDGLIIYVDAAGDAAATICRKLPGIRLAGFFTGANAILAGRTAAPDQPHQPSTRHSYVTSVSSFRELISRWRCRESNPGPSVRNQGFSGRILRALFSAPAVLQAMLLTGPVAVRCPARPRDRVGQWSPLADARVRAEGTPGLTACSRYLGSEGVGALIGIGAYWCAGPGFRDHPSHPRPASPGSTSEVETIHPLCSCAPILTAGRLRTIPVRGGLEIGGIRG